MHPVSVPANSTLPPVKTQKNNLAREEEEEEEEVPIQGVLVGPDASCVRASEEYPAPCEDTDEEVSRKRRRRR